MLLVSTDEMLQRGLELVGFSTERQRRVGRPTNLERFQKHYGSLPIVYAAIFDDLQMTTLPDASIAGVADVDSFLQAIYFLKCYPTESVRAGTFGQCERTLREKGWFYANKIQALKGQKIVWPAEWTAGHPAAATAPIFLVTVDGIHCNIQEPKHPTLSQNPSYYSHKSGRAALNYELAISVYENKLVWINGPKPASNHDITIFREKLKGMIPPGHLGIADNGYRGERDILSTPNSHDPPELRRFKRNSLSRHESFNGRIKFFNCLKHDFRHGVDKHKIVFEAVCVIVQYQLEKGSPLFDANV